MLIFVESILNSTQNNIINNNNKSVWGDKVNAQNDDYVEVEAKSSAADEQQEVEVTKGNHFSSAYGNIVMTTKRRLNEDKMSRPIIQTTTTTATTTYSSNDKDDNMIGSIMVPLPPELSDKSTIEDFNSRRRRGRLRSSCPLLLLPSPLLPLYNNKSKQLKKKRKRQKKKKKVKIADNANATKNILAAIEPTINKTVTIISTSKLLLSKFILLLLLLSFLIKYYVNKLIDKLINLTAACASKLFALYNHINYNGKRSSYKYNIHQQQQQHQQHNYNSYYKHSHNAGLVYAFLLCTSILLPSNINFAMAFKPKSVQTNLQQQQQEQQHNQHHETKHHQQTTANHNNNNDQTKKNSEAYEMLLPQDDDAEFLSSQSQEHLFDGEDDEHNSNLSLNEDIAADIYETHRNDTNVTIVHKTPLFPKDLFTKEQLENGAVIFHIIGVIYMFVALAIVCDEFFVPSLDVIIEKLGITDDVAGATFMAAGGSAPELFTSVIGVFVSFDDVGIGTIVGSAVFNILFVIGMCALFSKTVLTLTWWPLFRDCSFYSISLMILIYFFRDSLIWWWEALILFFIYVAYVGFMKWNVQVEHCVKKVISKNKPGGSVTSRAASESRSGPPGSSSACGTTGNNSGAAGTTHTGAKFRHGLLQLMIHTIDPLHDGKVDEKATQLHAIASLKVLLDATKPQRGGATTSAANHVKINLKETTLADRPNGNIDTTLDSPSLSGRRQSWIEQRVKIQTRKFSIKANEIEEEPEPLNMSWPDTARKRLTYILVAPLLVPMWLTLPDTRTPRGKKYFPVTFIGSILWIAAFSYLMVWWANVAGDTARIPPEVMGLTFLAAGTSIPDLITSVIVARKGFGDMAVSSSVGSNIFDVTVGLPVPWLLYGIIYGAPVEVNSQGMVCSITILFMMLLFVVMSIACFRWKMNKGLGFTMFLLYFVFVAVSLMFEYKVLTCPV